MKILSHLLVIALASLYILLAVQAEPVTATLGYIAAGLLTLAVITATLRRQ